MSEYLTKEEIKQWRSSLERITLEEFAQRLGKVIKTEKQPDESLVILKRDIPSAKVITKKEEKVTKKEKVTQIAKKAVEMEKKIMDSADSEKINKSGLKFKKPLTEREELVLNEFLKKSGSVVYAKDLAKVLNLPNDYIYKYIKNLRAKIGEEYIQNHNGGYLLKV